jgi:hypothetical protein
LPVEAQWGQVVLPAGEYSFTLDHGTVGGIVTLREETGRAVGYIRSAGTDDRQTFDRSELVLVLSGGNYIVRAVRLADLGITIEYSVPKAGKQQIVQGPQLLERIPVAMGG